MALLRLAHQFHYLFFGFGRVHMLPADAGFFSAQKFPRRAREHGTRHNLFTLKKKSKDVNDRPLPFRRTRDTFILMNELNPKTTPRDLFLHLFNAVALYASAISTITLLIQYVNVLFPDVLVYDYGRTAAAESIFWSTAVILVAYPAYLITGKTMLRDYAAHPEKQHLGVRRWITHATLFVSAIAVGGDLVALIYNFLRGELTIPFTLKVLAVFAVAGSVFWYVSWDRKQENGAANFRRKQIAWIATAALVLVVGAEFIIVGTPGEQRNQRLDQRRVDDLQNLQNQVVSYWIQKEKIPQNAEELEDDISGFRVPRDPETGEPYEYRPTGALSFEVCAVFAASQKTERPDYFFPVKPAPRTPAVGNFSQNWSHGAGRTCFSRAIDPEIYKPEPKR